MTTDHAGPPTRNAERRNDDAVDAIRSMSQDLADELAPKPTWIDQITYSRGAHSFVGNCISRWCDIGTPMIAMVEANRGRSTTICGPLNTILATSGPRPGGRIDYLA